MNDRFDPKRFASQDTEIDAREALEALGPRGKAATAAVIVLALCMFLLDFVVLKGEGVARVSVRLDETPAVVTLERVGEPHSFEIVTRKRVRGDYKGRAISWTITDPDGIVMDEGSELIAHERRFVTVTPLVAGEHQIVLDGSGLLGSSRGSATVKVLVGDRRIFAPLFAAL